MIHDKKYHFKINTFLTLTTFMRVLSIFDQYRMDTSVNYVSALILLGNIDWISELDIRTAFIANLKLARKLYAWQSLNKIGIIIEK